MSLLLIAKCVDCGLKMECENIYSRSRLKRCTPCKNKHAYQTRKLLLKSLRLREKKCHRCGSLFRSEDVFCTPYCRWMKKMIHQTHGKRIFRLGDL